MKFLILADLHANWHALQAVLADAHGLFDEIVCCGDLVGYNAQPGNVLDWTRRHCSAVVRGNHDKVVAGIDGLEWFNDIAQVAARWTIRQLSHDQLEYLRELIKGPAKLEHFQIWHGAPEDEDEYLMNSDEALSSFRFFDLPLAFFGHTHLQGGFFLKNGRVGTLSGVRKNRSDTVIELEPDLVYMINPGSVGQPRDGDPRAAYALYNSEQKTVTLHRVAYPIDETAREITDAGLPDVLALRLFQGV